MIKQTFTVKTPPTNKGIKKGMTEGEFTFNAVRYDTSDNDKFKQLYEAWRNFSSVGNYFNQRVNTPEGLSEGVVSKDIDGVFRKISSKKNKHGLTKFDCYDSINNKIVEVKACSIENDATSWSPKPFFDLFYFVDFSSRNGAYKIYKIDINSNEIKDTRVSQSETFEEQIARRVRPRFSVFEKFITPKYKCSGEPVFEGKII